MCDNNDWRKDVKCDPITSIFLKSIDPEEIKHLERNIIWILSLTAPSEKINSKQEAIEAVSKHLSVCFTLDEQDLYYQDPEEGEIKVINSFTMNFNNEMLKLVNFKCIAGVIVDKMYNKSHSS